MIDPVYFTRIRRLTQGLYISGILNLVLLCLLFYLYTKETTPKPYFEYKPLQLEEQLSSLNGEQTNQELLRMFSSLSMEQLIPYLNNKELVESGYTKRDLALSILVLFHHLDLTRALGGLQPAQIRKISIGRTKSGEPVDATVYPSLSDEQFESIIHFTKLEHWPLTSRGLYLQLHKQKNREDPTLLQAFFLTPEFLAIELLFNRSPIQVDKVELLTVILQGSWKLLSSFAEQQRVVQDLSAGRRQHFLINYIDQGSSLAALLLLKTDFSYAAKKMDNDHVLAVLKLLDDQALESKQFALALLASPRHDAVRDMAARKLYASVGEIPPENNLQHAALLRFTAPTPSYVKNLTSKEFAKVAKPNQTNSLRTKRLYTVQEGDSLWKISRSFRVDIHEIKKVNQLKNDTLRPGTVLTIP